MTEIILIMIVMLALVIEANMILYFTKHMKEVRKKLRACGSRTRSKKKN